jgi:hypothetical protein
MLQTRRMWGTAVLLSLTAGCGPSLPEGAKPTKPVTVTVTYKGAPLEGATITFINAEAPAYGRTDASGVAKMKTYVEGDGAIFGSHKVTINKSETTGGDQAPLESPEYNPDAPSARITNLIPVKYSSPATSGLTFEVSDSSPAEVKFDLTD